MSNDINKLIADIDRVDQKIDRVLAERDALLAACKAVEAHHVKLNAAAGRDEGRSYTLRIVREAIDKAEGRA